MQYRPEIDGLRAVAVVPVILFHAGLTGFGGGFVGVDVFFVISGYLITAILTEDLARGRFSIPRFYERRARRLLPALFTVIVACLPFAFALLSPDQLADFSRSLVAVVLFASNVHFWRADSYFGPAADLKPLLHTWSLAVEEQFYLVFPLVLAAIWRIRPSALVTLFGLALVASLALAEWASHSQGRIASAGFYLAPTRAWELLAGVLCALAPPAIGSRAANLAGVAGLVLILVPVVVYDAATPFPGLYAVPPVLGTALLLRYGTNGTIVARILSARPVVLIGLVSYSAYLWHQPLFAFARAARYSAPPVMLGLSLFALVLAYVTWRWIEQPFRTRALIATRTGIFAISAAAIACVLALGITAMLQNDRLTALRFSPDQLRLFASAKASPKRNTCHFGPDSSFSAKESCTFFGKSPTWAVMGNSHGVELAYSLAEALRPRGEALVQFTISGCPVTFHTRTSAYCNDWFDDRMRHILATPALHTVVLSYRNDNSGPTEAADLMAYANHLAAAGKRVVLVLQAPVLDAAITDRSAKPDATGTVPGRSRADWQRSYAHVYAALPALSKSVTVIDPADMFCDPTTCYAARNWQALFFDDDHMSLHGAALCAARILSATDSTRRSAQLTRQIP